MKFGYSISVVVGMASSVGVAGSVLDISGMQSWGFDGDLQNETMVFDVPHNGFGVILGIHYDITIETIGNSWLDEVNIRFGNSDGTFDGSWPDTFRPGAGVSFSGIQRFTGFFMTDFHLNPDSEVHISLFESGFDDNFELPDAILLSGSTIRLQFFVPAPGTSALLGLGMLGVARRRR